MTNKTYRGYDQYGNEFDVSLEIKDYLELIAKLQIENAELKRKLTEKEEVYVTAFDKPKKKEVKKNEW